MKAENMDSTKAGRIEWLDALRALAAILVVLGHQMPEYGTPFFVFMTPIQMPLFFILTGYFFKIKSGSIREMFQYLFFRILVPWLTLSISYNIIVYCYKGDFESILSLIYSMISGSANWYMICYMIAYTVLFLVSKYVNRFDLRIICLFAVGGISLVLGYFGIAGFAKFNTALTVQIYLAFGVLLKKYKDKVLSLPWWTVGIATMIYIVFGLVTCVYYPGVNLDVNRNQYYNYVISFGMVLCGNYALVRIFEGLSRKVKIPNWIIQIGQNTLVIYLLHGIVIGWLKKFLQIVWGYMGTSDYLHGIRCYSRNYLWCNL
ncbi:MAG: acyltransferase [Oscillospiraceae bacterium]|nr:acyltransferase [Oscillospiraceae bacterium]